MMADDQVFRVAGVFLIGNVSPVSLSTDEFFSLESLIPITI